ncbi:MAG: hypothetical protein M5R36_07670 [Deltaproteobacteria bacterium]|nr:hypothetical protein [Deltaproteobacteria bacterium]
MGLEGQADVLTLLFPEFRVLLGVVHVESGEALGAEAFLAFFRVDDLRRDAGDQRAGRDDRILVDDSARR